MEVLSDEETTYFIDLVQRCPCLYVCKDPHYKDTRVRENVWQEIAKEMKITSENCKKLWKTIRDGYMRFRRRNNLPLGSVVPKTKRTKWKLYRLLSFLDNVPHDKFTFGCKDDELEPSEISVKVEIVEETVDVTLNNIKPEPDELLSEDNKEQDNASIEIEQVNIPARPPIAERRIKKRQYSGRVVPTKKLRRTRQPLSNTSEETYDEFKSFAKYTEEVLKNLPTKLLQVNAKREIFDVLSKYEALAAENGMPSSPIPPHSSVYQSTAGLRSPLTSAFAPTPSSSTHNTATAIGSDSDDH